MKVEFKNYNGETQLVNISSLTITLNNEEIITICSEKETRPTYIPEGITIWGGKIPVHDTSLAELKESTRMLAIYPLAANHIHVAPIKSDRGNKNS